VTGDGSGQDDGFSLFSGKPITASLERFITSHTGLWPDDMDIQHGLTRGHMAWCRAVYWLSPVIVDDFWDISYSLSEVGQFDVRAIPSPAEAARLVDFEARLAAQQSAFSELSRLKPGHLFLLNWNSLHGLSAHLPNVHPNHWQGDEDGSGIGRVRPEYCWELGMDEGRGYPYFGVSRPVPLELTQKIADPALKVWTRVIWQLLHCDDDLQNAWSLPMPETHEAPMRMNQVLSLLTDSGYRFADKQVNAVAAMWTNRLELTRSGDRLDAERENRSGEYSREDLSSFEVLLAAGLNEDGHLSEDDLKLLERGRRGNFLDAEYRMFRQILAREESWIRWFNDRDTRRQVKSDLGVPTFNRRHQAVIQWLREQIRRKRGSGQL
jgi:hypothetical protein